MKNIENAQQGIIIISPFSRRNIIRSIRITNEMAFDLLLSVLHLSIGFPGNSYIKFTSTDCEG